MMGTDPLDEIDEIIDGRAAAKAGVDRLVEEQRRGEVENAERFTTWAETEALPAFQKFVDRFQNKNWESDVTLQHSNPVAAAEGAARDHIAFVAVSPQDDRLVVTVTRAGDDKVLVKRPNGRSGFAESEECVYLASMTPARIERTVIEATRARFGPPNSA
jgi:hypothetical protein